MALYKDVGGYRKLFDEEYKKTRELIYEGETHLDNLAEGFSEASRVIDRMPTADVVPKSEVEKIFEEIESEIKESLDSNYRARPHIAESEELYHIVEGKITALSGIEDFIAELKKKYIGE